MVSASEYTAISRGDLRMNLIRLHHLATAILFGAASLFVTIRRAPAQGEPIDPPLPAPLCIHRDASFAAGAVFSEEADAAFVAAGNEHCCLLTSLGAVKCWGRNNFGQLGNGTMVASSTPVQVSGLTFGDKRIALGANHSCAITDDGAVQCWGSSQEFRRRSDFGERPDVDVCRSLG